MPSSSMPPVGAASLISSPMGVLLIQRRTHSIQGTSGASYNSRVSSAAHRRDAPANLHCFVLTISDTRTPATDTSGDGIVDALTTAGHEVIGRQIVRDEPSLVRNVVLTRAPEAQVIITTGGTGITSRDTTYEAISGLLEKTLDGFGELFRMLSYDEIGSAAMLSRACGGTIGRTIVFALPGSPNAVALAMKQLIIPELGHISRELSR
jgi:molybdenum cofactor biosynthesis protein B